MNVTHSQPPIQEQVLLPHSPIRLPSAWTRSPLNAAELEREHQADIRKARGGLIGTVAFTYRQHCAAEKQHGANVFGLGSPSHGAAA